MRIAFLLAVLLLVPSAALAVANAGESVVTVYIYSAPEVVAKIAANDSGLSCSWTITDLDIGDTFVSRASWYREGSPVDGLSAEVEGCIAGSPCYSPVLAQAKEDERWTCVVDVTDSYGAVGSGQADYVLVPLGFFGGFSKGLTDFVCNFLHLC